MKVSGPASVAAFIFALVATALAQPVTPPPVVDRSRFVQVDGRRFVLGGRRFKFMGANASIMHGRFDRAAVESVLDAVAADGLKVVRVWALGEHPAGAEEWTRDYSFRLGPEGWLEASFVHLDRVVEAARARGLRVVVVLANRWGDYGGAPEYHRWEGLRGTVADPALPALGYFFGSTRARDDYRAHVARVVGRINATTGVPYRDDPTIMAWELINESDAPRRSRATLVDWTRTMAAYIHGLDPTHLVGAGHIGYTRNEQRETWLALQRLPEIDYADAHAYPTTVRAGRTLEHLDDFVDDHAQLAHDVLAKPFIWGEYGFSTVEQLHHGVPRMEWFERFLARSRLDDVDGAMAWIYTGAAERPREHGIVVDGPWVGETREVREVLARFAARWSEDDPTSNPRLEASRGVVPLWSTRRRVDGPVGAVAAPVVRGRTARWVWRPERFASIDGEAVGRWDGFAVMHMYGGGPTAFTYRLRVTPAAARAMTDARRVTVRFRASSELPGRGEEGSAEDGSTVRVSLDGVSLGEVEVITDDGLGRWVERASDDAAAVAALATAGEHTLRLEVVEGPRANGLCVYGHATGRERVPPGTGALPGRVEVTVGR